MMALFGQGKAYFHPSDLNPYSSPLKSYFSSNASELLS